MKQFKSFILSVLLSLLVIIGIVVVIIVGVLLYNWVVTDQTAVRRERGLKWNDTWYGYGSSNLAYKTGRFIAKTRDGSSLYSVVGDQEHNFVFVSSDNSDLMIREDYEFTKNEVTRVQTSKKAELCRAMQEILTDDSEIFYDILPVNTAWSYYTNGTHANFVIAIYYDHCSVGFYETVAYVQGKYVIVTIDYDRKSSSIYNDDVAVRCKVIDEKHLPVLRKHLGGVLDEAVADAKAREEKSSSP